MKFAQVTYGSQGATETYTYLVNDSVKAGAVVYPVVTHYKSKNDFTTMGIVQETHATHTKGKLVPTATGMERTGQKQTKFGEKIMEEINNKNMDVAINNALGEPDNRNKITGLKYIKTGNELGVYHAGDKDNRDIATGQIIADTNKTPSRATGTTPSGNKKISPQTHISPRQNTFSNEVMDAQLQQQTTYGFETIYPKK